MRTLGAGVIFLVHALRNSGFELRIRLRSPRCERVRLFVLVVDVLGEVDVVSVVVDVSVNVGLASRLRLG